MNFKFKEYQSSGYISINKQPAIYISATSKYAHQEYRDLITVQVIWAHILRCQVLSAINFIL